MTKFKIEYLNPETEKIETVYESFEDWTGRAELNGIPEGPIIIISARKWAEDAASSYSDKHWYEVTEIK